MERETVTSSKGGRRRHKKYRKRQTRNRNRKTKSLVAYGKIYADWCGFCVALKPEWEKVERAMMPLHATNIESKDKDNVIDIFNRKYHTDLPKDVGFPTIFKLHKYGGKVEIYKSERNANDIIAWLKTKHSPEKKTEKINFFGLF